MTDFLALINYEHWILNALILLPLAGVLPIALAPAARARQIALGVTVVELCPRFGLGPDQLVAELDGRRLTMVSYMLP